MARQISFDEAIPPNHPLRKGAIVTSRPQPSEPTKKPTETPKPSAPNSDSEQPQHGEA